MTVCVIGGDHFDAALGVKLLAKNAVKSQPVPISNGPEEYDAMIAAGVVIEDVIRDKMKAADASVFIVFCNTLSFAVDWEALSTDVGVPVLNLSQVYPELLKTYKTVGVLACFENTNNDIKNFLGKKLEGLSTLSFSLCSLVRAVEDENPIVDGVLKDLVSTSTILGAEAFVMGCTHFEDYRVRNSTIDIIYPGQALIQLALDKGLIQPQQQLAGE